MTQFFFGGKKDFTKHSFYIVTHKMVKWQPVNQKLFYLCMIVETKKN